MKELEDFYNNHYKTDQMLDWSELGETQKEALNNSREYWKFKLDNAINDFCLASFKEVDKLIELIRSKK